MRAIYSVDVYRRGLRDTRARVEFKEATQAEALQAQLLLDQATLQFESTRFSNDATWRRLSAVVGRPNLQRVPLEGSLTENIPELSWTDVLQQLEIHGPQLARARLDVNRAQASIGLERARSIPNFSLQGGTQYDDSTGNQFANVQVGIQLPLRNRNQGNIIRAQADYIRAVREVERVNLAMRQAVAEPFRRYAVARNQEKRYRESLLPTAQKSLELSEQLYKLREIDSLVLQKSQQNLTATNQAYVRSLSELWQSAIQIESLLLTDGLAAPDTRF